MPGATTAEEFLTGLREGRGRPGGEHGSAPVSRVEIYGVVARYMASLAGFGPCAQPLPRRIGMPRVQRGVAAVSVHPAGDRAARQGARTRARSAQALRASWSRCSRAARPTRHGSD